MFTCAPSGWGQFLHSDALLRLLERRFLKDNELTDPRWDILIDLGLNVEYITIVLDAV